MACRMVNRTRPYKTAFGWDGSEGGWLGAGLEAVFRDGQDDAVITATGNSSGVSIRMQRPDATQAEK